MFTLFKKKETVEVESDIDRKERENDERIKQAGGKKYYTSVPIKPYGLYRAMWITPDGESQWFAIGVNKKGCQWAGNEISKPSPMDIDDFVCFYGPDVIWEDQEQ